jgi:hypothetical protein
MLGWLTSWWTIGVLVAAAVVGVWLLFRSFRRWPQRPPSDPEARQAEARLWSTHNMDQR